MGRQLVGLMLAVMTVTGLAAVNLVSAQTEQPKITPVISDLDWNPDGSTIAIGMSLPEGDFRCITDPDIDLLDVDSRQMTHIAHQKGCSVTNVDFSPDGSQLLTTSDTDIEIWDVDTGLRLQGAFSFSLFRPAFWHPNGEILLAVEPLSVLIISSNALGESTSIFSAPNRVSHIGFTYSVWSPDGSSIASSASDGQIYIWDVTSESIVQVFSAHETRVQRLAWSSTLNLIASGDDNGTILVWNPETGETVAQLDGHTEAIRDLDWRSDGEQIASAGADDTIRTWQWPAGEMQIVDTVDSADAVAYSPDGSQLAYAGLFTDVADAGVQIVDVADIVFSTDD